jgi:hypothetical protein
MCISLLSQYRAQLGAFNNMRVSELIHFLLPHRCVLLESSALAVEAYHKMIEERVNGAAVIDENGILQDVLSTRDLKIIGVRGARFEMLWLTVADFKAECRKEFPEQTPHSINYVIGTDTMADIIQKMQDGNLHRVSIIMMS